MPEKTPDDVATEQPKTLCKLAGIDVASGVKRVMGKTAIYIKLLENFYHSNLNIVPTLTTNIERGDFETAKLIIHTLKGVAGTIGANKLQHAAKNLEFVINQKDASQIRTELIAFNTQLKPIIDDIYSQIISQEKDPKPVDEGAFEKKQTNDIDIDLVLPPLIKSQIEDQIKKMMVLLQEDDMGAEDHLHEFKDTMKNGLLAEELKQLERHMDQYDYKNAALVLSRIDQAIKSGNQIIH